MFHRKIICLTVLSGIISVWGDPNATDEEVEEAARQSGCDSFIRALDNGYDTVAGGGGGHLIRRRKTENFHCKGHVKKCTDCYSG